MIPQKAGGSRTPGRLHRPAWTESLDAAKRLFFLKTSPQQVPFKGGCTRFVRVSMLGLHNGALAGLDAPLGGCL